MDNMENNANNSNPASSGPGPNDPQPAAYDTQGRPLYLHPSVAQPPQPQATQQQDQPQTVYMSRPLEPREADIPEHIQARHVDSTRRYPRLNLSDGEYILNSVKRHPIGLIGIWLIAIGLIVALAAVLIGGLAGGSGGSSVALATGGMAVVSIFIVIGAMIASYVYNNNRFYLTNESVIQEIQTSPFNRNEQTVSLSNIEDASYRKDGILAYMFNFGTIRLSTEGDETTYRFSYVANPKQHIAVLNNAVESFKNGRPVEPPNADQAS